MKATKMNLRKARTPTIGISTTKKFVWGLSDSNTRVLKGPYYASKSSTKSSTRRSIRAKNNSPVTGRGNKKKSTGVRITNNELTQVERQQKKFESWLGSFDY
eukprot:CAMPEP_0185270614 /NCGR_PEP_ID=MMETSP1359-20130426/42669_1 /TAXON_ID=552665 /ORGANISM="Bigelowiella longifila, Strain CCMP242" /LENGTH=101 /DNA_ID=CAMNT_0027862229 /DNA_START=32 /DNA_END=337 /DNA_ORIENTATION=+